MELQAGERAYLVAMGIEDWRMEERLILAAGASR